MKKEENEKFVRLTADEGSILNCLDMWAASVNCPSDKVGEWSERPMSDYDKWLEAQHAEIAPQGTIEPIDEPTPTADFSWAEAKRMERIEALQAQLAASDYKVIKIAEGNAAGDPCTEYDVAALHQERDAIRKEINRLQGLTAEEYAKEVTK